MHNQQQQGCTELQQEHLIQQNQLLQHQIANITNTNKPIQHQEHSITHLWFSEESIWSPSILETKAINQQQPKTWYTNFLQCNGKGNGQEPTDWELGHLLFLIPKLSSWELFYYALFTRFGDRGGEWRIEYKFESSKQG